MSAPGTAPRANRGHNDGLARVLRARWRNASLAAGWPFPADWDLPEVDELCRTLVVNGRIVAPAVVPAGSGVGAALLGFATARAESGAGLDETLHDLAALHAVLPGSSPVHGRADPDAVPTAVQRAVALAWADVLSGQVARLSAEDGLTGLTTVAYLRTRLREIYQECAARGVRCSDEYVLIMVTADLSGIRGWSRLTTMVLIAEVLRTVFVAGETLTAMGSSVAVVLARRDEGQARRVATISWLLGRRFAVDPELDRAEPPKVRVEQLPATLAQAHRLIGHLGRN